MVVPPNRTLTVFAALIGSMTLASAMLLLLLPGPVAPISGIHLSSIDTARQPEQLLFATTPAPDPNRWSSISICYSGQASGSARMLNQLHERLGYRGLVHHFVLGNGHGAPDGQIDVGFRWRHQLSSTDLVESNTTPLLPRLLDICLVGDGKRQAPTEAQLRELIWLVRHLQKRFQIPAGRVQVANKDAALFPVARFRQQILRP